MVVCCLHTGLFHTKQIYISPFIQSLVTALINNPNASSSAVLVAKKIEVKCYFREMEKSYKKKLTIVSEVCS